MGDEKYLPSEREKRNQLQNSGENSTDLISNAFANLDEKHRKVMATKAADEALRLESKWRDQRLDGEAASHSVKLHLDALDSLNAQRDRKRKRLGERIRDGEFKNSSDKIINDVKTGAGNMRIESTSAGTCFVATAAYEDEHHPDVVFLRLFRDGFLSRYYIGKRFISWYYRNGPKLASKVKKSHGMKVITLSCLKFLVSIMRKIPFNI
jgi:hypothetical protein